MLSVLEDPRRSVWHGLWILEVLPNGKYFPQGSPRIARKRIDDWHCPLVHLKWLSGGSFSGRVQARGSFPVTHCKTGRKAGDNSGRFLKFAENRNQGLTTTPFRVSGVKAVDPRLGADSLREPLANVEYQLPERRIIRATASR